MASILSTLAGYGPGPSSDGWGAAQGANTRQAGGDMANALGRAASLKMLREKLQAERFDRAEQMGFQLNREAVMRQHEKEMEAARQAYESGQADKARGFQSSEAAAARTFQSTERGLDRAQQAEKDRIENEHWQKTQSLQEKVANHTMSSQDAAAEQAKLEAERQDKYRNAGIELQREGLNFEKTKYADSRHTPEVIMNDYIADAMAPRSQGPQPSAPQQPQAPAQTWSDRNAYVNVAPVPSDPTSARPMPSTQALGRLADPVGGGAGNVVPAGPAEGPPAGQGSAGADPLARLNELAKNPVLGGYMRKMGFAPNSHADLMEKLNEAKALHEAGMKLNEKGELVPDDFIGLPEQRKTKAQILGQVQTAAAEFLKNNPDMSKEELRAYFTKQANQQGAARGVKFDPSEIELPEQIIDKSAYGLQQRFNDTGGVEKTLLDAARKNYKFKATPVSGAGWMADLGSIGTNAAKSEMDQRDILKTLAGDPEFQKRVYDEFRRTKGETNARLLFEQNQIPVPQ